MSSWKDYFHFQKIERQGLFVLITLIIIVIIAINALNFFERSPKTDFAELKSKIEVFESSLEESEPEVVEAEAKEEIVLFEFDPNNLPISEWRRMGLSEKQAEAIKNYEEKGGVFRDKQDLKKMYTISPEMYSKIKNYILLPEESKEEKLYKQYKEYESKEYTANYHPTSLAIDINTTDSPSLMEINGIGPAFSLRIIKYRELLGGFHSKEQLREVWGLDSALYEKVRNNIVLTDSFDLHTININSATTGEMKKHPYINWYVANSIYKFRIQNGKYKKLEEIRESHLISDSLYRKIAPYLRLE